MKVTVDFECTPEEARRFIGLPDLTPLHSIYVDRMRTAVEQGMTPDLLSTLVQAWGPMGETGFNLWKTMVEKIGGKA